jgi:oligoendopeptidase F
MLTEKQINGLRSENELLNIQLEDVNTMIKVREEELELLRERAKEATEMQSKLDNNLNEFEQMQISIGNCQQKNDGHYMRLQEMENELYESVKEQLKYANTLREFNSLQANLDDTNNELQEASAVYKKMAQMKTTLAQTQSNLEIALMEIESLKQELAAQMALNEVLLQKNIQ